MKLKATWISPDQRTTNQIDHVLIDGRFFSDITNIRTYCDANIDSDHYLVAACMRSKLSTVYNARQRQPPRLNIRQLQNSHAAENYAMQLEVGLPSEEKLGAVPLEDGWSRIRTAIGNAAEAELGTEAPIGKYDWYDDECQQMSTEKKAAWARLLQTRTRANKERYRRARNQ